MDILRMDNDVVINPSAGKDAPELGPVAVMAATVADCNYLNQLFGISGKDKKPFFCTTLRLTHSETHTKIAVAGPFIGAPHAAMIIENLIVCGVKTILFLGWCGAVSKDVKIGDIILPTGAYSDEGTSRHYGWDDTETSLPTSLKPTAILKKKLEEKQFRFQSGDIWTTDAIYRETIDKIALFQKKGALGVEMELSSLISICRFRNVEIASLQVVSDDVSSGKWKPGFKNKLFKANKKVAANIIVETCMELMDEQNG